MSINLKTRKSIIISAIVLVALSAVLMIALTDIKGLFNFKTNKLPISRPVVIKPLVDEVVKVAPSAMSISDPEAQAIGELGEVVVKDEKTGEEKPIVSAVMPLYIPTTVGKIVDVQSDFFTLDGDGNNFADNKPRRLKCFFTDQTLTITENQTRYIGKSGLAVLRAGQRIIVEGEGTIRGKDEFTLKSVAILE